MKTKFFLLFAWTMLATTSCSAENTPADEPEVPATNEPNEPTDPTGGQKVLVVSFSHTGNTRTIAGYIHNAIKSDLIEIKTTDTYTDDYNTLLAQIREEVAASYCPPLATQFGDIASYDVIFVGYPIWVETVAPPIRTFLTMHNLAGKTIVPFCTSGTSSAEASYRLVRSLCPQSTVLEGIQIRRGTYDTAHARVLEWLQKIGVSELINQTSDE